MDFPEGGVLLGMYEQSIPFVMVDNQVLITCVNQSFKSIFGWHGSTVIGLTLDVVLPEAFRMSHHLAFSTFDSPESSKVVGHPLELKALCSDGSEILTEHYIVAENSESGWCFGAFLKPLET